MGAAFGERKDVVDFLHRRVLAVREALLTQWVFRHKLAADTLPATPISFFCIRVAPVFFILLGRQLLMRQTVSSVGQFRATLVSARFLGFIWHGVSLLRAKVKPLRSAHSGLFW